MFKDCTIFIRIIKNIMINKVLMVSMLAIALMFNTASATGGGGGGSNGDKVFLCHRESESEPFVKISVSVLASIGHILHGDIEISAEADCPVDPPPAE
jgi:hypothetical protein